MDLVCKNNFIILIFLASKKPFVYYLTVVRDLTANQNRIFDVLKKNSQSTAENTYLFIAYPRESGNNAQQTEEELREFGNKLKEEIGAKLEK